MKTDLLNIGIHIQVATDGPAIRMILMIEAAEDLADSGDCMLLCAGVHEQQILTLSRFQ